MGVIQKKQNDTTVGGEGMDNEKKKKALIKSIQGFAKPQDDIYVEIHYAKKESNTESKCLMEKK